MESIITTAGVLLIKDNKVLLVKHLAKSGHMKDAYGIPAGTVDEGETEQETASRELSEETGLIVPHQNLEELPGTWLAVIERGDGQRRKFSLKVFVGHDFEGHLIESPEAIPEWVNISDLGKYNLLPNIKEIVNKGLSYARITRSRNN